MRSLIICGGLIIALWSNVVAKDALLLISEESVRISGVMNGVRVDERPNVARNTSGVKADPGGDILKSFLLPGWGQISQGRKRTGYAFLVVEASLWASFLGLRTYGAWLAEDYETFAEQHAGVKKGSDHELYIDIGNWMNRDGYNEQRQRERYYERLYTTEDTEWDWDSDENRLKFKSMRLSSDGAKQKAVLFMGGIVFNHLASAIEAGRKGGKKVPQASVLPMGEDGWKVNVAFKF